MIESSQGDVKDMFSVSTIENTVLCQSEGVLSTTSTLSGCATASLIFRVLLKGCNF